MVIPYWIIVTIFFIGFAFIWVPWLTSHKIKPYFGHKRLLDWLDNRLHSTRVKRAYALIQAVYRSTNAQRVSAQARKKLDLSDDQYLYGEIHPLTLIKLLDDVKIQAQETFYDLGCGAGQAVLMADACFDLKKSCGIEIIPQLANLAKAKLERYKELLAKETPKLQSKAVILEGDFLLIDLADADVVFINATGYKGAIWDALVERLKQLKVGARIIVTTFELNYPEFEMIYGATELMSWGFCSVRLYTRI